MKYVSLFSGIGGFEVAIHKIFENPVCLGYSEVKPSAIKVYQHHYPNHNNLGDITKIKSNILQKIAKEGCDLLVGGFPCTNLSSMASIAGDDRGLKGIKSCLFYTMLKVIKIIKPKYILIENNYSMSKLNKNIITEQLQQLFKTPLYINMIDSADFGVQSRKRLFWTNFEIKKAPKTCIQTWENILLPKKDIIPYILTKSMINCINCLVSVNNISETRLAKNIHNNNYKFITKKTENKKSRWDLHLKSDNNNIKSQTFVGSGGGGNNIFIDRRFHKKYFIIRYFTPLEVERLFHYEDDYTVGLSKTARYNTLGNSVVPEVVKYILLNII
jgi:DNA-cytosine methyltransferase